jgi:hypothetical protein
VLAQVSDDRSFDESPGLHAADNVIDISPSASRIDLSSPVPAMPVTPKPQSPPTPDLPPPVPPKTTLVTAPRKRALPPIKIPNGSIHAPKVIVEREQSAIPTAEPPSSVATIATEPQKPQPHAGRRRSVGEMDHAEEIVAQAQARKDTVKARPRPVASRKSTASAFEYGSLPVFTLPPSAAGDRLSVTPPGRADSATLPEDSPSWQPRRLVFEDDRDVPPIPALPPALAIRRSRTLAVANKSNNNETTRVVLKRDESLRLPGAISTNLLPITLRHSNASSSASEATSSTFSQLLSGYQRNTPPPQNAVSVDSTERKSSDTTSSRPHTKTPSMGSEAGITLARTRTASPAPQPNLRGASPPVTMTPAGTLGQKTLPTTAPAKANQSTTPPPVLHSVAAPASSQPSLPSGRPAESPRRTDSLHPPRAVERLMANRGGAAVPSVVPSTPGTGLTLYFQMYTGAEVDEGGGDEDKDGGGSGGGSGGGEDPASSAGSSSFTTGPSPFGPSTTGTSPSSLLQGTTTPGSGQSTLSKTVKGHSHFRTRSVSDAAPASLSVLQLVDRRPSLPEPSTQRSEEPIPPKLPEAVSALSSGVRLAMERALQKSDKSQTPLRSTESTSTSTRPGLPVINTNPPPMRDLSMFPHTARSLSPEVPYLDTLPDTAKPSAAPSLPGPATARPKPAETVVSVLGSDNLPTSSSFTKGPMRSSALSSYSRRDRALPVGPRQPALKGKGAEAQGPRPITAPAATYPAEGNAASNLPTPAATPPGQTSSKPRLSERSISSRTHSRTHTKFSASTSGLGLGAGAGSIVEKIVRPATPTFDTVQVAWRGLTLDVAKWTFSSAELHALVGRAIRQSADPMCIRLLPIDLLDRDLPAALEDLQVHREGIKAEYSYQVRRRRGLMRGLAAGVDGATTPVGVGVGMLKLVEELAECVMCCDQLSEELFMVSDQIAQIGKLREGHSTSALAMVGLLLLLLLSGAG